MKKILLVDYQSTANYNLPEEIKEIQRVKKAIIYVQNKRNNRDVSRKTRKNYSNLVLALGGYLKDNNHEVYYVSLPDDQAIYEEKVKDVDFAYFWSTTPIYNFVKKYIVYAKSKNPDLNIILGGYHATGLYKQILEQTREIDCVSIGESEIAVNSIMNGVNLQEIRGIAFRNNGEIIVNGKPELLDDDSLTMPDYSLLNGDKKKYRYYLQMTRSCVHRCKYCVYGYFGGKVRTRSLSSIRQELIELKSIMGSNFEMHILDNVISYDRELLVNLIKMLKELEMNISFSADIRPEDVTDDLLSLLEQFNVKQLFIGFEDASEECRRIAGRKMKNEVLINALSLIKNHNSISANCYWMLGLPSTTVETFAENISFVNELFEKKLLENICPDTIFVPLPGTPFYDNAEKYGISGLDDNWGNYRRSNYWPVYDLKTISREQIYKGLIDFDKSIISTQLRLLGMTEEEVLEEYFLSNRGQNVEEFLK